MKETINDTKKKQVLDTKILKTKGWASFKKICTKILFRQKYFPRFFLYLFSHYIFHVQKHKKKAAKNSGMHSLIENLIEIQYPNSFTEESSKTKREDFTILENSIKMNQSHLVSTIRAVKIIEIGFDFFQQETGKFLDGRFSLKNIGLVLTLKFFL